MAVTRMVPPCPSKSNLANQVTYFWRSYGGPTENRVSYMFSSQMRTRGDMLSFAIAFAMRGARKLVRGLREELTEEERYGVANDVVHRLKQHGDPWRLSEDLQPPGKGHST